MKTSETKTASPSQQTTAKSKQNFFQKEGESAFFSEKQNNTDFFFSPQTVQPKLKIGQPGDRYEQEADAMAEQVSRKLAQPDSMPEIAPTASVKGAGAVSAVQTSKIEEKQEGPEIQCKPIFESEAEQVVQTKPATPTEPPQVQPAPEEEERNENGLDNETEPAVGAAPPPDEETTENDIQARSETDASASPTGLADRLARTKGYGAPLPEPTRHSMESAFGADFSGVRVHTSTEAGSMNEELRAQAFTHGSDIYFNEGKYNTESTAGKELLAHELTHTVQQGAAKHPETRPAVQTGSIQKSPADASNQAAATEPGGDVVEQRKQGKKQELDEELANMASIDNSPTESPNLAASGEGEAEAVAKSEALRQREKSEAEEGGRSTVQLEPGEPITIVSNQEVPETPEMPPMDRTEAPPAQDAKALQPLGAEEAAQKTANAEGNQTADSATEAFGKTGLNEVENARAAVEGNAPAIPLPEVPEVPASTSLPAPAPAEGPEAGEEAEEDQDERPPEAIQQEAAGLVANLRAETEGRKQTFSAEADTQIVNLQTEISLRVEQVRAGASQQIAEVNTTFTSWRETLTAYAARKKAEAGVLHEQQAVQVETATAAKIETARAALVDKKETWQQYVLDQKQLLIDMANSEADRSDGELETAANQAIQDTNAVASRYPGEEDPQPKQREAARGIGTDAAREIRDKKPGIREELVRQAEEFGGKYDEYRDRVIQQIDDTEAQMVQGIQEAKASTLTDLQEIYQTTLQRIDDRLAAAMEMLSADEQAQIAALESKRDETIRGLTELGQQAETLIQQVKAVVIQSVDEDLISIESDLAASEGQIRLATVNRTIEQARESIQLKLEESLNAIRQTVDQTLMSADESLASWQELGAGQVASAKESAAIAGQQQQQNLDQALNLQEQGGNQVLESLDQRQQSVIDQVLAQIDLAIEDAKGEIAKLRDQFRTDIQKAADDALLEAKKPLTDQARTRAEEAAEQVAEPRWSGLLRAIGDILYGLLVVVAIAVVLVAVAAALGFVMTLTTAMLLVGAALLIFALVVSLVQRASEVSAGASRWRLLMAIPDAIGITAAIEGFRGKELFTDRPLSPGESWYRAITGTVQTIMVFLGARSAIRGGFRMPTRMPGVRGGFMEGLGRFTTSIRGSIATIGSSLASAGRSFMRGVRELPRNIVEFAKRLRIRFGRNTLPNHENALIDLAKFSEYSMNPSNPRNGGKWQAFDEVGYDVNDPAARSQGAENVIEQVRNSLPNTEATPGQTTPHGPRFEVRIRIQGPNGRTGTLVTVWQYDGNGTTPRLITNWLAVHR